MKKIYLPFIAFSISLASCSKTPPNASNTEITDALKMLISAVDFSQSATYEKDLLLESIHVYSASCNNTSKQDLLCSVSFNYAKRNAEGKINNLQTSRPDLLINMRYRENGWQIDADKFDVDEIINTAKLALEPQASEAPQAAVSNPMPSDWFGKWIGSGNVGSFGMSAAVSLSVVEQGAVFKVENCSGGTTAEMKASDGAFSVLPIGPCDPGSFRVKSADSESMIVSIPRGGKYLDIKLVRAIGIHDDISVFPNSSVDIMNFPIGGPNSIREAAAKLKLRPFASGNEFRMEDIAASSDRISIGNRTGEAFVILFEKDVEEDESDNNRSLAFLRYFIPSEQNSPSFKETQIGLIEKYGEPSLRFNENKYAWLYTDQGIKLNGDNVKKCDKPVRSGYSLVPSINIDVLSPPIPFDSFSNRFIAYAQQQCGWSLYADIYSDNVGKLKRLEIVSYDQKSILRHLWREEEKMTLNIIREAIVANSNMKKNKLKF